MVKMTAAAAAALIAGDKENFIAASTPGGIERQEAAGQQTFVTSERLPKEMIHGCTREILEQMGVLFGEDVDDNFVKVSLPEGWVKKPTDHSMWSDLLDDQGRKRAAIFYKAAFYDCHAHISLNRRFSASYEPEDKYQSGIGYDERDMGNWYGVVSDGGREIFRTDPVKGPTYEGKDELTAKAKNWLSERYPDYENVLAYWG